MARINKRKVLLLDTPGFDDSARENLEVLNDIISHLYVYALRRTEIETRGVIFLHDISEKRFAGSQKKTLSILKALVGIENLGNVIVGTTMWSSPGSDKFKMEEQRERNLLNDQWKGMYKTTRVLDGSEDTAAQIVADLFARPPVILLSQQEMLQSPHTVENTSAGKLAMPESRLELAERQREQKEQAKASREEGQRREAAFQKLEEELRQKFEDESRERDEAAQKQEAERENHFEEEKQKWNAEMKIQAEARRESLRREQKNEEARRTEFEQNKKKFDEEVKQKAKEAEKELEDMEAAIKTSTEPPKLGWFMRIVDAVRMWFGYKCLVDATIDDALSLAVNIISGTKAGGKN